MELLLVLLVTYYVSSLFTGSDKPADLQKTKLAHNTTIASISDQNILFKNVGIGIIELPDKSKGAISRGLFETNLFLAMTKSNVLNLSDAEFILDIEISEIEEVELSNNKVSFQVRYMLYDTIDKFQVTEQTVTSEANAKLFRNNSSKKGLNALVTKNIDNFLAKVNKVDKLY